MSKYVGYIVWLSGILLVFNIFGLSSGTTSFMTLLLDPIGYKTNFGLYVAVIAMVGLFILTGGISLFLSGSFKIDFIALAPIVLILLTLLGEMLSLYTTISAGSEVVALLVFSPLVMFWLLTTIEWWRGLN